MLLIDVHAPGLQVLLRQLNLLHKLLMCLGHVVECQHSPPESEEHVCAEGDEEPEWELWVWRISYRLWKEKGGGAKTYDWDDLLLDNFGEWQ